MMKKMMRMFAIVGIALVLTGCSFNYHSTNTETVTENGVTTTTTTTNDNGNVTTQTTTTSEEDDVIVATITFKNTTGVALYGLYCTPADNEDWGDNLIKEDEVLDDGVMLTFDNALTYGNETLVWDLKIVDVNGVDLQFADLDFSKSNDPNNISIMIGYDEEVKDYYAEVEH